MNILVTGGRGFIGQHLIKSLARDGHQIKLLSRKSSDENNSLVTTVQGDLTVARSLPENLFSGIDIVFHCAGEVKSPDKMAALHVDGTRNLLNLLRDEFQKTKKAVHWVQLSSVGAYGSMAVAGTTRIIDETSPENPRGEYEVTKTKSDRLVVDTLSRLGVSFSILRPSNVFGREMPNQSLRGLIGMINRGLFFYIGRQESISTYVHVDDVVAALTLCAFDPRARNQIFNISNDCPLSSLVEGIATALQRPAPRTRLPMPLVAFVTNTFGRVPGFPLTTNRMKSLVSRTTYSNKKLDEVLNFLPRKSVPEAISELIDRD